MSLSKWLPCDFEQCHPLLWGGGILVDHWSTISSFFMERTYPFSCFRLILTNSSTTNRQQLCYRGMYCVCLKSRGRFYHHCLTLTPAWIGTYTQYKVLRHWSLRMDNSFCFTLDRACGYLCMLWLKRNPINKRVPRNHWYPRWWMFVL